MSTANDPDPEIQAITTVYAALKDLDGSGQKRVIEYVLKKLNITLHVSSSSTGGEKSSTLTQATDDPAADDLTQDTDEDLEGVSPAGKKWVRRNGFTPEQISSLYSLGVDDIDLVVDRIPGDSKRVRTLNVALLKGVASYLSSGVPRFTFEQLKEACLHYDAYDTTNHSTNVKSLSADVAGSRESGFTLTARGLTNATKLIKELTSSGASK
jgi:hypothetical protein